MVRDGEWEVDVTLPVYVHPSDLGVAWSSLDAASPSHVVQSLYTFGVVSLRLCGKHHVRDPGIATLILQCVNLSQNFT